MNIRYDDIHTFKRYDLSEIIRSYGIELKKSKDGYLAKCPFHDDKNPSLSINKKGEVWLWHCFGCREGGTVIDFVMRQENLPFKEAYERLKEITGQIPEKSPKNAPQRLNLLKNVLNLYHKTFLEDKNALEYLAKRGIKNRETYQTFKIGYSDGSLPKQRETIPVLKELGILNDKGNEFFYSCLVVPFFDENGNVVSFYGRSITRSSHLYLKGPHKGIVNRQGAYGAEKVILTESVIDALSLYEMGIRNVIPLYGTGGFTEDHKKLLKENEIKEAEIAFDSDEAGEKGAQALSGCLEEIGINSSRVILPEGIKDLNNFLLAGKTKKDFEALEREILSKGASQIKKEGNTLYLTREEVSYRVKVSEGDHVYHMRVNIKLTVKDEWTVDVVDLYSQRSRKSYTKRMAGRFKVDAQMLEKDLHRILQEAEKMKVEATEDQKPIYQMTDEEKERALAALKSPHLVKEIIQDLEKAGCVGEDMNKLLGYIITVSRKLDMPLSMIIVSQSSAGKSNLADTLEAIIPPEDCMHLSRITPQALYYMAKQTLKRKVLIIEEKEGSMSADYSIRVLQSRKRLRLAVPVKDPETGKRKTCIFEVEGPVVIIETTTRHEINPENASRCFIVYLDESRLQTERIHAYQKKIKTIEGARDKKKAEKIIKCHQDMQRLLEPVAINNPFVEHIKFPTKWLRGRRDHMKFLNLIEAVTFLHQHQRGRKLSPDGIEYIESTPRDYRIAYEIARDVIGDSLAELAKPEREFREKIKEMVKERNEKRFTRRNIREYTGLPDHLVRRMLNILVQLEYILVAEGKNGIRYEYTVNPYPEEAKEIIRGLTTPDELEKALVMLPCDNLAKTLQQG